MCKFEILHSQTFYHDNLILQIQRDTCLDLFYINIHRINTKTDHDLFGVFMTYDDAIKKFNTIKL